MKEVNTIAEFKSTLIKAKNVYVGMNIDCDIDPIYVRAVKSDILSILRKLQFNNLNDTRVHQCTETGDLYVG